MWINLRESLRTGTFHFNLTVCSKVLLWRVLYRRTLKVSTAAGSWELFVESNVEWKLAVSIRQVSYEAGLLQNFEIRNFRNISVRPPLIYTFILNKITLNYVI